MMDSWILFGITLMFCSFGTPQAISSPPAPSNLHKLSTANNFFGLHMLRQLSRESSENILISPFSLSTVFGMLYYGTRGAAATELRKVLGYQRAELLDVEVHSSFQNFIRRISRNNENINYTLDIANALYVDKSIDILPKYKREIVHLYNASVEDVDFSRNGPRIVSKINNWVKAKTRGKIETLIETVSSSTAIVLLNAVYFKGKWKTQFNSHLTSLKPFHNHDMESRKVQVPMMHITSKFPFARMQGFDVLELPYKGENMSMLVFMPDQHSQLADVQDRLDIQKLEEIRQKLRLVEVQVSMPKFKVKYSQELSKELKTLGAKKIFRKGSDFSGMSESPELEVSDVHHKAVLEVTEEGSVAAGATSVHMTKMAAMPPARFNANRPFLFAIKENRSDMFLFIGNIRIL